MREVTIEGVRQIKFICNICGYEHYGYSSPEVCPICKGPQDQFYCVETEPSPSLKNGRFEIIASQHFGESGYSNDLEILRDKVTGVHYIWRYNSNGGGLAVLVVPSGKPVATNYCVEI